MNIVIKEKYGNNVNPGNPRFAVIKLGCKDVSIIWTS